MAKINGYKIHNMTESSDSSVNVTSYPVEKGMPLNDSVQRNPDTFSVSGKILNKSNKVRDAGKKFTKIKTMMEKGKVVKYVGRMSISNVLITNLSRSYSSTVGNGFEFNMSMQKVRVATTPFRKKKTTKKSSGKKSVTSKKKTTTRKYHTVKRGDTYWGCSRKYGTTVAALRKLNPWPDRKIPIGVKMRIK